MSSRPENAYDWVKWLLMELADVRPIGQGLYVGRLPVEHDFDSTVDAIERSAKSVLGLPRAERREIEFNAVAGHHYESLEHLLEYPQNRRQVPRRFFLRNERYEGPSGKAPTRVAGYLLAVQLWEVLKGLADHVVETPPALHFISSPDRRVELLPMYTSEQVVGLEGVEVFDRDYVRSEHHREQKRDIIRVVLIELFHGRRHAQLGELVEHFPAFADRVRASYATYAADFSYKKVRTEVEKQNLDDTLRLNKTLSEIQNQLLALPAALLLAGAGLEPGYTIKNIAIVAGVTIFALLMGALVINQRSSINSIAGEVGLRKKALADQPADVSKRFADAFDVIDQRVTRQKRVINWVLVAVISVWACVVGLAITQAGRGESIEASSSLEQPVKEPAHRPRLPNTP